MQHSIWRFTGKQMLIYCTATDQCSECGSSRVNAAVLRRKTWRLPARTPVTSAIPLACCYVSMETKEQRLPLDRAKRLRKARFHVLVMACCIRCPACVHNLEAKVAV